MEDVELALVLRNTEKASQEASRDACEALVATERLVISIGVRFDVIESRISTLETRLGGIERRMGPIETGINELAGYSQRIEIMLGDIYEAASNLTDRPIGPIPFLARALQPGHKENSDE